MTAPAQPNPAVPSQTYPPQPVTVDTFQQPVYHQPEPEPRHAVASQNPPADAVTDQEPALSGVLPEQTPETDGVDLTTMPEFRSLKGQLPAARFHAKRQLADLEKLIPAAMRTDDDEKPADGDVLANIADIDALFQAIQDMVLDRAVDRDAMTAWLIGQESGEEALMAAFGKLSDNLGN